MEKASSYIARGSHKEPGVAASDGFTKKMSKYHNSPDNLLQGRGFLPISMESFRRFHPTENPLLALLCPKATTLSGVPKSVLVNYWSNRISASLQKNIAKMLIARVERVVSSSLACLPLNLTKAQNRIPTMADTRYPRMASSSHVHFRN